MKSSRSKSKSGNTRMLPIKLPSDHPIFSYPDGERSQVAREWLEQGRQGLAAMEEIKKDIAHIKRNLSRTNQVTCTDSVDNKKSNNQNNGINPNVFLNIK